MCMNKMIKTAGILTIGDELLIGQTIDTNSAWIGAELTRIGVEVIERLSIRDDHHQIIEALDELTSKVDVVLITGGLGPTKDDITKKAIADFLGLEMEFSENTWVKIQAFFEQLGRKATEAHRIQCYMPERVLLLANEMGTAPGMLFHYEDSKIISMPGVPYEMKYIMSNSVLPILVESAEHVIVQHTIQTIGRGESMIADAIDHIVDHLPPYMSIAFLPSLGKVRLRVTAKGQEKENLEKEVYSVVKAIKDILGDIVFGEGDIGISEALRDLFVGKGLTVMTAESCTGGRVASKIVEVSGSSAYYLGSLLTYSNEMKMSLLNVSADTLKAHGAVSEPTVLEMVKGGLQQFPADVCVSISGIAGPTGGTPTKPVGTVWMAVGNRETQFAKLFSMGKDRMKNIEYASNMALDMLRKFVLKYY